MSLRFVLDLFGKIGQAVRVVCSMLSEIFDESAYARFLQRNKLESSRETYALFLGENEVSRVRRHRCC
jgi:hypothetical protein